MTPNIMKELLFYISSAGTVCFARACMCVVRTNFHTGIQKGPQRDVSLKGSCVHEIDYMHLLSHGGLHNTGGTMRSGEK